MDYPPAMAQPGVPGGQGASLELSCGESVNVHDIDLGQRELSCGCGSVHAVVTDAHPLGRFLPESIVAVLQETVDTADEFDAFGTPHLLGMVMEEFPEQVVAAETADAGEVGYALVWVSDFDSRRLHEIVVELVVELMEHAISHAEADDAISEFESHMHDFDVETFVDQYRAERDFETEHDTAI